jgi:hypothetical protein
MRAWLVRAENQGATLNARSRLVLILTALGSLGGIIAAAPSWASLLTPQAFGGALLTLSSVLGAAYGVETKHATRRVARGATLGLLAVGVLLLGGCGTAGKIAQIVPKVEVQSIDCGAITSAEKANEALANAQVIRIGARDFVASLYPSVIDKAAVELFDEKLDKPLTNLYRRGRKFVDSGQLEDFRGMCEALKATVDALLPVVKGGGGQ